MNTAFLVTALLLGQTTMPRKVTAPKAGTVEDRNRPAFALTDAFASSSAFAPDMVLTFSGTSIISSQPDAFVFSRSSPVNCPSTDGNSFTPLAANVPCIVGGKLLVEGVTLNAAQNSENLSAGWADSAGGGVVTSDQCVFADGAATMDLLDSTAGSIASKFVLVGSSTFTTGVAAGPYASSAWVRAPNGGGTRWASVTAACRGSATTPATCRCERSDGGTCTATNGVNTFHCAAHAQVDDSKPVRLSAVITCPATETQAGLYLHAGKFGTSATQSQVCFAGMQLERGNHASSYVKVPASTLQTRNGTSLTRARKWYDPYETGVVEVAFTPRWSGTAAPDSGVAYFASGFGGLNDGWGPGYASGAFQLDLKATSPGVTATGTRAHSQTAAMNTTYTVRTEWDKVSSRGYLDGVARWSAAHGWTPNTGSAPANVLIGSLNGTDSGFAWGWLGPRLCMSKNPAGCK